MKEGYLSDPRVPSLCQSNDRGQGPEYITQRARNWLHLLKSGLRNGNSDRCYAKAVVKILVEIPKPANGVEIVVINIFKEKNGHYYKRKL